MTARSHRALLVLLLAYGAASLIHFTHNAELVRDYPGLPETWTRAGVYLAWLGLTAVGVGGWLLLGRGFRIAGLGVLAAYALLGIDSLGHYVLAPMSAHTAGMNSTILLEVTAASLVLLEVARQLAKRRSNDGG
jgi:hypothetical protein